MTECSPFGALNPLFASLGALVAFYATFRLVRSLFKGVKAYILAKPLGLCTDVRKYGEWAVVTGATDGIGKAYAEQLAAKGLNVVLLSRTQEKLNTVAMEIESKYKVKTQTIAVDFAGGSEIYSEISQRLTGLNVGVLVNNVGMSYSYPQFLHQLPDAGKMTSVVLPGMLERKKGIVINISSASAMSPSPLLTVYSASKAYVDFFTRALQTEYGSKGIIFQSVLPFFVSTKLSKIRRSSLTVPTPTDFAKSALATLGVESRTNGCMMHAIQGWVLDVAPEWLVSKVQMTMHLDIRNSALKKLQQKKAE